MAWTPITTIDELEGAHEHSTFDAKKGYDQADLDVAREEMAKDVAAFATAHGGTLLVGAKEQGGRVVLLTGIAKPKEFQEELSRAVSKLCLPLPSYTERVLSLDQAAQTRLCDRQPVQEVVDVVIVNVYPMPAGPVAVRSTRDRNYYKFPVRVGDQTEYLDPIRLSQYMNPHDRQIALLLQEVLRDPLCKTVAMQDQDGKEFQAREVLVFDRSKIESAPPNPRILKRIDEQRMVAVFHDAARGGEAHVPLTFIRAVWRSSPNHWSLALEGALFRSSPYSGGVTPFIPFRGT